MNNLWSAGKAALVAAVLAFLVLMVVGIAIGGLDQPDPEKAGESFGKSYGWLVLVAPLAAYIVQKWRIDRHEETLR